MKLRAWIKSTPGMTLEKLAEACGFSLTAAGRYAQGLRIPRKPHAIAIYLFTGGLVMPNDFYDLPPLEPAAAQVAA